MSHDARHDSTKKVVRSNSDDDVRLRPVATIVHSKQQSQGGGEMSFGVRHNTSSISSSNEYVVPSAYQNISSAAAVSFVFFKKNYNSIRHYFHSFKIFDVLNFFFFCIPSCFFCSFVFFFFKHLNIYFIHLLYKVPKREYISDRQHVAEHQSAIIHTYELSLPIKFLPGEDDVKLKEGY